MSVGLYRVEYKAIGDMGRAEANWLMNHVGANDDNSSVISIARENLEEYISDAQTCTGCEYFNSSNKGLQLHAEVTKEMTAKLEALFAEADDDYIDISISW